MSKLHQVIAVESSEKTRYERQRTEIYKKLQKEDLFTGLIRTYAPKEEEGEQFPTERKEVQLTVEEAVSEFREATQSLLDITATKDFTNMKATADVKVDGSVLIANVPVPFLLFLEKQLADVETFVRHMPTLGRDKVWKQDSNSGLYKSEPEQRNSTKKIQKAIVLYDATPEHPAQTQLITEDIVQGVWTAVSLHGGISETKKKEYLEKVAKLRVAVKEARSEANDQEIEDTKVADTLLNFVFG